MTQETAQIGACIGREFPDELLAQVSPVPRSELDKALDQLVRAELVFRRGQGRYTVYVFKHALVQDAAYDSLLGRGAPFLYASAWRDSRAAWLIKGSSPGKQSEVDWLCGAVRPGPVLRTLAPRPVPRLPG